VQKHFPHCLVCWDVELRQGISGLVFQRTIPLQSGGAVRFDVVVADEKALTSLREAAGKYGALRVIGEAEEDAVLWQQICGIVVV